MKLLFIVFSSSILRRHNDANKLFNIHNNILRRDSVPGGSSRSHFLPASGSSHYVRVTAIFDSSQVKSTENFSSHQKFRVTSLAISYFQMSSKFQEINYFQFVSFDWNVTTVLDSAELINLVMHIFHPLFHCTMHMQAKSGHEGDVKPKTCLLPYHQEAIREIDAVT